MNKICKNFKVDIFQIPLNILNRGCFEEEVLSHVRSSGTEIHIRSIFLQGLLLMTKKIGLHTLKSGKNYSTIGICG